MQHNRDATGCDAITDDLTHTLMSTAKLNLQSVAHILHSLARMVASVVQPIQSRLVSRQGFATTHLIHDDQDVIAVDAMVRTHCFQQLENQDLFFNHTVAGIRSLRRAHRWHPDIIEPLRAQIDHIDVKKTAAFYLEQVWIACLMLIQNSAIRSSKV